MFKEILQIIPKLSPSDLSGMENALSTRFGRIAKRFGKGLVAALTGGGIAGVALGIIDKLLNPLKETQDAIDKVLKQGDDIVTNAQQFGTTAGKLLRLQALGISKGLDPEQLNVLLTKFQTAVAEAIQDPTKQTAVRNFTGDKDTAESFFQFIQSLQKMTKQQQLIVQQEVFGEKQILKMADFLQTDFVKQDKLVGGPDAETLTRRAKSLSHFQDLTDRFTAQRGLEDFATKGKLVNNEMIRSRDEQIRLDLQKENKQIASYENLAAISIAATQITAMVKDGLLALTGLAVRVTDLTNTVKSLTGSRAAKGLMKMIGGGN